MNKFIQILSKNRPLILTALGVGGMIATAVMAYKSYPVVTDKIAEKGDEIYEQEGEERPLTKMETAKVYAKCLWPTFLMGGASALMIGLGHKEQIKRTSALATAYYLSESTLKEYQEKVIEEIGEKKEKAIRDKVSTSKMEKVEPPQTVILTDDNKPWICDSVTGCYFRMNYEKFRRIVAEANLLMFKRDFLSVSDLYELLEVELPPNGSEFQLLGWSANDGDIEIYTTSALRDIRGETVPCMVLEYRTRPKYNYNIYGH